jgi:hypothetical protein
MPEHDQFDLAVQSALSSYGDPGPESGLDERILARIDAEGVVRPRQRWIPWVIAAPIAAGLLLLLVLSSHSKTEPQFVRHDGALKMQAPLIQQLQTAKAIPEASKLPRPARRECDLALHNQSTAGAGNAAPLPKLDVFPTPQPLTPEERALATFAAEASETERQSFIEAQEQTDAPLSIASITIQPLDPPDHDGN